MQSDKCDACGGEIEFRQNGSVQGFFCKKCDFSIVTTYIPAIELDETRYQVRISSADFRNEKQVRVISSITGLNFIAARKLLQQDNPLVLESEATNVLKVKAKLLAVGLCCEITPQFNY